MLFNQKFFKTLLFLLIILFPFGVLTSIPFEFNQSNVRIYLNDVLVFFLVTIYLVSLFFKRANLHLTSRGRLLLIFLFIAFFSLTLSLRHYQISQIFIGFLYFIRLFFYFSLYFVILHLAKNPKEKNNLLWLLMQAGTMTALLGILQYFFYPDLRNLLYLGFDPHNKRIFGTFLDPNFLGIIMVLTSIIALFFLSEETNFNFQRKFSLFTLFISLVVLILTYSRSSYLSFILVILSLIYLHRKFIYLIPLIILLVLASLIPKAKNNESLNLERTSTIEARIANYEESAVIIRKSPVIGIGFNNYGMVKNRYFPSEENVLRPNNAGEGADSSLLFTFATTGIIGLFVYLSFWTRGIFQRSKPYFFIVFPSTLAVFVHSIFVNSLYFPWVIFWFVLIWGISDS